MARLCGDWAAGVTAWVIVLGLVCESVLGREVKLEIRPQKVSAEAGKYVLLPPAASQTDGDAVPLYEKAVNELPADTDWGQIHDWLALPIEQLPLQEVQRVLERHTESLQAVTRAARCRECKWPRLTMEEAMANLPEYRMLGFVIRLQARYEIAQKNYEGAILALQTGFGLGRHLTQAPTLIQFLVGVAVGSIMCREVEVFGQADSAPNLHAALATLPRPFTDVEQAIEKERSVLLGLAELASKQVASQMKATHDGVRGLAKRLDRDLAALQCIEGIRSYAASHGGQLPETLADLTEVSVPKDPVTGEAFRYARTGATAVLESPAPAGDEKGGLRYEIIVKN